MARVRNTHPFGILVASALLSSCVVQPADDATEDVSTIEQEVITNRQIDFSSRPSYLATNSIVLTFDDGPDDVVTPRVLDILKTNGVKATFFVNTANFTNVATDPTAQALIQRMVNEGHEIGNHTVHHFNLGTLGTTDITN